MRTTTRKMRTNKLDHLVLSEYLVENQELLLLGKSRYVVQNIRADCLWYHVVDRFSNLVVLEPRIQRLLHAMTSQ